MNNLNFVQVPMSALIRLDDINLKIYGIIYTSCKLNNNKFYHSYQQFADELCVSIRNVKYSVKYLANNGYIEIERGRGFKKPNVYHIPNGAMDCTINSTKGSEINPLNISNGATGCTINGAMDCTQKEKKEKIEKKKEKEIYKENEKRKSVTKNTSNLQVLPDNENNNNKIKLNMSKQYTKNPENENTPNNLEYFQSSENTNPSNLQTNNGNPSESSHCFSNSGLGCDNPNDLQIQVSGRENTKNGDNPNKAEMNNPKATRPTTTGQNTNPKTAEYNHEAAGATETAHRGFNGAQVDNYPTHTEKMPQKANKWTNQENDTHSPMNGYIPIDELEDIYNGGQTIPKPQSKAAQTKPTEDEVSYISIAAWKKTMRNIQTKVETDTKLNQSDFHALLEGSQDPMRVIDTLKTIKMLINNFIRLNYYWKFLDECEITIPTIRSDKQRKYAKDLLKECDKYYDQYLNMLKKII